MPRAVPGAPIAVAQAGRCRRQLLCLPLHGERLPPLQDSWQIDDARKATGGFTTLDVRVKSRIVQTTISQVEGRIAAEDLVLPQFEGLVSGYHVRFRKRLASFRPCSRIPTCTSQQLVPQERA